METQSKNRRISPRRLPKTGTKLTCRKGSLGLGPDLAAGVLDISETGARLLVKEALEPQKEVELGLLGPGLGKSFQILGEVIWCLPLETGQYCAGIRYRKRLGYYEFQQLTRAR